MLKSDGKLLRLQTIGSSLQPDDSFQLQIMDMRERKYKENRVLDNYMSSNCPSIDIRAIHREHEVQTYSVPHTQAQVSDINDTYIFENSEIDNAKCSKNLIVHLNFFEIHLKPFIDGIKQRIMNFMLRQAIQTNSTYY
jgi:hypothetical protein